jgi:hypothetical protein
MRADAADFASTISTRFWLSITTQSAVSSGVFGTAIARPFKASGKTAAGSVVPRSASRFPAAAPEAESFRKEFPECGESDKDRYKKKCDDHLDDCEVHGVARNEITRDGRGKDHDRANDKVQHVTTTQGVSRRSACTS